MNAVGELVTDRGRISQIGRDLPAKYKNEDLTEALAKTSEHIVKTVNEIQDRIMQICMLPIGTVFGGFPRMVRDLAQGMEKKIDFVVEGQDTEIDRTVIEKVRDPIVHLLRNSVDHGIETAEERRLAGKPEMGTLKLSAYHEQGHIVVAVQDDGKGIDPEVLKAAAVKKGLVTEDAIAGMSDEEAQQLVFLAGNSTAKKTTDVSGRGVGMDIVRANIESINGFVNLESKIGLGTKFMLRLPLTLATVHSLMVKAARDVFAIPLVYVLETKFVSDADIHVINRHEVFKLRNEVLPLVRMCDVTGLESVEQKKSELNYVVVVTSGDTKVGIVVDAVIEPQEIVVKSLGNYLGDVRGVSGASILGDGNVALIIDIPTTVNMARQNGLVNTARLMSAEQNADKDDESDATSLEPRQAAA